MTRPHKRPTINGIIGPYLAVIVYLVEMKLISVTSHAVDNCIDLSQGFALLVNDT